MRKWVKKGVLMALVFVLVFSATAQSETNEQAIVCQAETWGIEAKPYTATCNISQKSTDIIKVGGKEYRGKVYSFIASDDGMLSVRMDQVSGAKAGMTLTTVNPTIQDATQGDYETKTDTSGNWSFAALLVKTNQRVWLAVYGTQETFTSNVKLSVSVLSSRVGKLPVRAYGIDVGTCSFSAKSEAMSSYVMPFVAYETGLLSVYYNYGAGTCEMYLRDMTKKVTTKAYKAKRIDDEESDGVWFEFGVVKGREYELVVKYKPGEQSYWNSNILRYDAGCICATLTSLKYPSGSKKSKAETIKKKVEREVAISQTTGARWYKFKVTKKGKVSLTLGTKTTGTTKYKVYNSKGKEVLKSTKELELSYHSSLYVNEAKFQKKGTLSAGTYYVKVYGSKGNSGLYTLSYK